MTFTVADFQFRERTNLREYHPWMQNPDMITEQERVVGDILLSASTTSEAEGERQDRENTTPRGSRSFFVVLDLSSTEIVHPTTDWSASTSTEAEKPEALTEELHRIFFAAREEVFEDGMDSVFSRRLVNFMESYSRLAIDILSDLLILEQVNAEIAGEALRHVGYLEHSETRIPRRRFARALLVRFICKNSRRSNLGNSCYG